MSKTPIRVAGTCAAGHTLEREADHAPDGRPRLTWRGTCPTEGCNADVIARRVKGTTHKGAARGSTPAAAASPPSGAPAVPLPPARRTVRKVTAYRDAPTRTRQRARSDREPAGVPATAPVPAVAKPADLEREPDPADPERQPRRRRRFSFGGPDARDADGFTIPGIY